MDRLCARFGVVVLLTLVAGTLVSAAGCRMLMTTAAYLIRGTDADPDFAGLKGKKVAVVCRPIASLTFGNSRVGPELAREVTALLKTNVPKIQVIESQKVAEWCDNNDWTEYPEIGKALKADIVVGIDLADFRLLQGSTLYQGRADVSVFVYDMKDKKEPEKMVFEKHLPQVLYPPNSAVPASSKPEAQFRRDFLKVLADQVGRLFYAHDRYADMARDALLLD